MKQVNNFSSVVLTKVELPGTTFPKISLHYHVPMFHASVASLMLPRSLAKVSSISIISRGFGE